MRVSNAPAIALYEQLRLPQRAGTRRRYYPDTGEDAMIMWRAVGHAVSSSAPGDPRDRDELRRHLRGRRQLGRARSRSNVISSQGIHDRYGGVVPEIASRHHLELIGAVLDEALARAGVDARRRRPRRRDARPGTGRGAARRLLAAQGAGRGARAAVRRGRPPARPRRRELPGAEPFEPPFLSLIASGGHTLLARGDATTAPTTRLLGQTLDDAAGEAFDKGARLLGLGYPGGPALERLARDGRSRTRSSSRPARGCAGLDFSFAGLKTSLLYKIRDLGEAEAERRRADLAASYQRAIVEALTIRVERALAQTGLRRLAVGGGVAANGPLRERLRELGVELDVPAARRCAPTTRR